MSVTDTLGRIVAGIATLFSVICILYIFNYFFMAGGVNALYIALTSLFTATVCLIVGVFFNRV